MNSNNKCQSTYGKTAHNHSSDTCVNKYKCWCNQQYDAMIVMHAVHVDADGQCIAQQLAQVRTAAPYHRTALHRGTNAHQTGNL